MKKYSFIHLRVHSEYSMSDGLSSINNLITKAVSLGMPAIAITDFNNLFGVVKFCSEAHSHGIKPIIGIDIQFQSKYLNKELSVITILACNEEGYRNIRLLISEAYSNGYNSKIGPVITDTMLIKYKQGIIILSGGYSGDLGKSITKHDDTSTNSILKFWCKNFKNKFYIELTRTRVMIENLYTEYAIEIARKYELPVVATNRVCFISKNDFIIHKIRMSIHDKCNINKSFRSKEYSEQQYLKSELEMQTLFADLPEALENSVEIAKMCNVVMKLGKCFLPNFVSKNLKSGKLLEKYAVLGLKKRLASACDNESYQNVNYMTRLNCELKVINDMGFQSYFLIVMEFVRWAKLNKIPVGPGRGSGASSLVAFALGITEIDPIKFDLLFERFLNKERASLPDLDIDFCVKKRDYVIDHVIQKYGKQSVSQIISFGRMTARAAIRDVGRTLGYQYQFVDRIAKLIPSDIGITLHKSLKVEKRLSNLYHSNVDVKNLIDTSMKLEGTVRNVSTHSGGVVISPGAITNFLPLYFDQDGKNQLTQFDKSDIALMGLVKFDFLGLKTLTVIDSTVSMINYSKKYSKKHLDISLVSLDNKKCFSTLKNGETTAVFQLESNGIKHLIKRLSPDRFEDIIALIALFRPGPLYSGMVNNFINRKHGKEAVSYPEPQCQHHLLKPILKSTYGIILYQEQVMKIAQVLANYTFGEADILCRAIAKKDTAEMKKQKSKFISKSTENGIANSLAFKIFNLIEKFAGYGFNKSHATAYAIISYQTLWLKSNYPAEFMASTMTSEMNNTNKIFNLIKECNRLNIKINPPNVNSSLHEFYVNKKNEINYGIGAIKGVGKNISQMIVSSRNIGGKFINIFDFCYRTKIKTQNKKAIEQLIMSGAFDTLDKNRSYLIKELDDAIEFAKKLTFDSRIKQRDIFNNINDLQDIISNRITYTSHVNDWSIQEKLNKEKRALGFHLTDHIMNYFYKEVSFYIKNIKEKIDNTYCSNLIIKSGIILKIRSRITNANKTVSFVIDNYCSNIEIFISICRFKKYENYIKKYNVVIVVGKLLDISDHTNVKISAKNILELESLRDKYVNKLIIHLKHSQVKELFVKKICNLFTHCKKGQILVMLTCNKNESMFFLKNQKKLSISNDLLIKLYEIVGVDQIKLGFN